MCIQRFHTPAHPSQSAVSVLKQSTLTRPRKEITSRSLVSTPPKKHKDPGVLLLSFFLCARACVCENAVSPACIQHAGFITRIHYLLLEARGSSA